MDDSPWWPVGIIAEDSDSFASGQIQTAFGTIETWQFNDCLSSDWWSSPPNDGNVWGEWPEVTQIDVLLEDRKGLVIRINPRQIARISPFAVGNDLSRLMQYRPWSEALNNSAIVLPSMVYFADNSDRIAVYNCSDFVTELNEINADMLATNLGSIHRAIDQFSTPNTERRWNDRLRDIEAELKVTTLWRAPHSKHTVGLPRLNLDLTIMAQVGNELSFIADIRSPVEQLLCEPDRLPGLASLMSIEQQISFSRGMSTESRKSFLYAWLSSAPESYGYKKSLSTLMGGPWIWRYHAVLLALGEARIYADLELGEKAEQWLNDVSRIQAHLGVLRLWKSGLWGGIIGAIVTFFAWRLDNVSPTVALIIASLCLLGSLICNLVYWSKDPRPY